LREDFNHHRRSAARATRGVATRPTGIGGGGGGAVAGRLAELLSAPGRVLRSRVVPAAAAQDNNDDEEDEEEDDMPRAPGAW